MKIEEETDETPTTNNSSRAKAKESRKTDLIRRDEANPHVLYRNPDRKQTPPPAPCHPVPRISLNKSARRILSVNLQTLCLLLFVTPLNILNVYIFITEDSCEKNGSLSSIGKICTSVAAISGIVYLCISWKKLKKVV